MKSSRLLNGLLFALTLTLTPLSHADEPAPTATPAPANANNTSPAPDAAPQSVVVVGTPDKTDTPAENKAWYSSAWDIAGKHLSDIWEKGDVELYVPFWTYHMPFAYTPEKLATYTSYPAGGGLGKGWYNESGNWEGIYAMEYQDSHGFPMYTAGYGWVATWRPIDDHFRVGAGVTAFMFMRKDIGNYAPIPAALPVLSSGYGPFDVQMAYIPGGKGNGNVLFWWAKYSFK